MSKGGWRWGLAAAVLWLGGASAEEFSVDTVILSESPNDQTARSQPIHLEPPSHRTYLIRFDEPALPAQLRRAGQSPGRRGENSTRLDTRSPEARSLIAHIDQRQQDHLQTVAAVIGKQPEMPHQYRAALTVAALRLTPEQAARIAQVPMVASIQPDTVQKTLTDLSPDWLGATQLWNGAAVTNPRREFSDDGTSVTPYPSTADRMAFSSAEARQKQCWAICSSPTSRHPATRPMCRSIWIWSERPKTNGTLAA